MIEMVVGIVRSGVVSDPLIIFRVNVGRGGMTGLIRDGAAWLPLGRGSGSVLSRSCGVRHTRGRGSVSRNMSVADAVFSIGLWRALLRLTVRLVGSTLLIVAALAECGHE
jgi:hypothetical protein